MCKVEVEVEVVFTVTPGKFWLLRSASVCLSMPPLAAVAALALMTLLQGMLQLLALPGLAEDGEGGGEGSEGPALPVLSAVSDLLELMLGLQRGERSDDGEQKGGAR